MVRKKNQDPFSFTTYKSALDSGDFEDMFCFGIEAASLDYQTAIPTADPNSLFIGEAGSGKSAGLMFTVLTHFLSNSEKSAYIILDNGRARRTLTPVIGNDNCIFIEKTNQQKQVVEGVIDTLLDEFATRRRIFSEHSTEKNLEAPVVDIVDYEERTGETLCRFVIVIESFYHFLHFNLGWFDNTTGYKENRNNSYSNKFLEMLRYGGKYGLNFLIGADRVNIEDDMSRLIQKELQNLNVFRCTHPTSIYLLNNPTASDISPALKGRYISRFGAAHTPMLTESVQSALIEEYKKEFKAKFFKYKSLEHLSDAMGVDLHAYSTPLPDKIIFGDDLRQNFKTMNTLDEIKKLILTALNNKDNAPVKPGLTEEDLGVSERLKLEKDIGGLPLEWRSINLEPLNNTGVSLTLEHILGFQSERKLTPEVLQASINNFAFDYEREKNSKTLLPKVFMGVLKSGLPYNSTARALEGPQDLLKYKEITPQEESKPAKKEESRASSPKNVLPKLWNAVLELSKDTLSTPVYVTPRHLLSWYNAGLKLDTVESSLKNLLKTVKEEPNDPALIRKFFLKMKTGEGF